MNRTALLLAIAGLSATTAAQEVTAGTTADVTIEANNLFPVANVITNVNATFTAGKVTTICGGIAEEIQFGTAKGFLGANGFVISNAWVENQDEEGGAPMGDDPTLCANFEGTVGQLPAAGSCSGTSATLAGAVTDVGGAPVNTEDAAIFSVTFDAPANTVLDVSYNLMTYELPSDPAFYDSWGIFLDGNLVAGGTTNGTPPAGTDPWSLSPSGAAPSEYNSMPVNGFYIVPANNTGLRTVELDLGPAAGTHTLEFHVADGQDTAADATCGSANDNVVDTSLFVGLHTYQSGNPGGTTAGLQIGRTGHPTVTGGPFGDDLQITLDGASAGQILLLGQSIGSGPAVTIPLLAPNEILISLVPLTILTTQVASGTGSDVYPPVPPAIPATVAGSTFHYQWWAIGGGNFDNSEGMRLRF